jgi:hypothetical protein
METILTIDVRGWPVICGGESALSDARRETRTDRAEGQIVLFLANLLTLM